MKTVFYFCLFFSTALYAQEAKNPDSLKVKNELDTVHSFKKAIIFSACLPGAGQVYNSMAMQNGPKKAYWKVPLIYSGLGATGYLLISNQKLKNNLKQEYILRGTGQQTAEWAAYDDPAVLSLYQQALSFRDLSILAFGAVYLIQILDAGVEAHFVSFDVSDNLSLTVDPMLMNLKTPGFSIKMNFR